MNYEDKIQVRAKMYSDTSVIIGDKLYRTDNGTITDEIVGDDIELIRYTREGYPIAFEEDWFNLSKCFISFNSSAQKIRLNDGNEYIYSYYVILPLRKSIYHLIPKEGDWVHIIKADGTIDKKMQVRGFVTYKKRYLKIWL